MVVSVSEAVEPLTRRAELYVAASPVHGRGVFAAQPFDVGDTVEECPVLFVPAEAVGALGLDGYCFEWTDQEYAVALGYGSLYNHSWRPNARYEHDYDRDTVFFIALRPIGPGEEVTINYNGDPEVRAELWFEDVSPT